jgi:hypothetical protein
MRLDVLAIMLRYRELLKVEDIFRTTKSILDTRPIYHQSDEAIRGHVFCSFLALVLRKALEDRLAGARVKPEWGRGSANSTTCRRSKPNTRASTSSYGDRQRRPGLPGARRAFATQHSRNHPDRAGPLAPAPHSPRPFRP